MRGCGMPWLASLAGSSDEPTRTTRIRRGVPAGLRPDRRPHQLGPAVHRAVDEKLTARQRTVFVALVLNGMPSDVLADQLGATQNAIYKMMFDARRKLRTALADAGYLPNQQLA